MQVDDTIAAVRQFHTATGSPVADKSALLPGDQQAAERLAKQLSVVKSTIDTTGGGILLQQAAMAIEELAEWLRAHAGGDLVGAADAWAERAYVLFGDAVASGLPASELFAEVHRSNMSKNLVADGTGKATKGANYRPPNLVSILEAASHGH
ncbi:MAG: hypothetical protein ACQESR_23360 [Planctomycetota bacterium]